MRSRLVVAMMAATALLMPAGAYSAAAATSGIQAATSSVPPAIPGTSSNFTLVGHNPLYHRGMNAAAAIFGNYLYVGNRSDGSNICPDGSTGCAHPHPGILILNIANPAEPDIVGEIGPPFAGNVGITTRELRVWPQQKLLMVMTFRCSHVIHDCAAGNDTQFPFKIEFFDLSEPVHPRLIESYVPTSAAGRAVKPHEMYLWADPANPDRALLFISTPTISTNEAIPNLMVVDISQVPGGGPVKEVAEGNWNDLFPGTNLSTYPFDPASPTGCGPYNCNLFVHSMAPTADGKTTYMAMEAGQFLALDTSSVVAAPSPPTSVINLHDDLLTNPADRPVWEQTPLDPAAVPAECFKTCPNGHSAVPIPGTHYALTTDEVYGTFTDPSFGCPWGWVRVIDVADPAHPVIVGEYKIAEDQQSFCGSSRDDPATEQFTSYSSHNPTVLPDLAFVDWHSGGIQAINLSDPTNPTQAGFFLPKPLNKVALEDPALSEGPNKVVFWSYPIIRNGLIYAIDIRNGLYVLKYTGPHADEVAGISFLEGNSNLGDAVRLSS
jgi:hypothetical protein